MLITEILQPLKEVNQSNSNLASSHVRLNIYSSNL